MGNYRIDLMVKVFDLRTLRALPPISYPAGPYMLAFHPRFSSTLLVAAQQGLFQFAEVGNTATMPNIFQVRVTRVCSFPGRPSSPARALRGAGLVGQMDTGGNALTSMDISSTGQMIVFGDSAGYVYEWAGHDEATVNPHGEQLEPLPLPPVFPAIAMTDATYAARRTIAALPRQSDRHRACFFCLARVRPARST